MTAYDVVREKLRPGDELRTPDRSTGKPFTIDTVAEQLYATLYGDPHVKQVTLARAELADFDLVTRRHVGIGADEEVVEGEQRLAVGANSHVSARYEIEIGERREAQSSSGIIVSTGAGSTGWLTGRMPMLLPSPRFF